MKRMKERAQAAWTGVRAATRSRLFRSISPYAAVAVVAAVVIPVTLTVNFGGGSLSKQTLSPGTYDNVQVVISQEMASLTATTAVAEVESEEYDGYTIVDGSVVENSYTAETTAAEEETVITTLQKQGDVIYEDGISGEQYFYSRDGAEYVLYLDTYYGLWDPGKWTEVAAENFNVAPSFDFDALGTLSAADFVRQGAYYVPRSERLEAVFFALLSATMTEKYSNYAVKLWAEDDRLTKIAATYVWDGEYRITQTYAFTYGGVSLTVPGADATA